MGKVKIIAAKNITQAAADQLAKVSKRNLFFKPNVKTITTKLKSNFSNKPGVIQKGKILYYSGGPAFSLEKQRTIKKGAITYILGEPKTPGPPSALTAEQVKEKVKALKK